MWFHFKKDVSWHMYSVASGGTQLSDTEGRECCRATGRSPCCCCQHSWYESYPYPIIHIHIHISNYIYSYIIISYYNLIYCRATGRSPCQCQPSQYMFQNKWKLQVKVEVEKWTSSKRELQEKWKQWVSRCCWVTGCSPCCCQPSQYYPPHMNMDILECRAPFGPLDFVLRALWPLMPVRRARFKGLFFLKWFCFFL